MWTAKQNEEISLFKKKHKIRDTAYDLQRPKNLVEAEKRRILVNRELEQIIDRCVAECNNYLAHSQLNAIRFIKTNDEDARVKAVEFDCNLHANENLIGICKKLLDLTVQMHYSKKGK